MPFESEKQRKFLFKEKPAVAKKFTEHAESSASTGALFKENLPKKVVVADIWKNLNAKPPQAGRQLEAAEDDTLMGRLAKRMASRDMIDELNLGPKGRTGKAKQAQVADNFFLPEKRNKKHASVPTFAENEIPSKMMVGPGRHEQMHDKKSVNMSDPIPSKLNIPGSTMRDQAKVISKNPVPRDRKPIAFADHSANEFKANDEIEVEVEFKHGDEEDSKFNAKELKMGIKVEKEHSNSEEIAKQIAKAHLSEFPDYYTRLAAMEKEGKKALKTKS